ncbi:MAG: ferritin-like domain-containing protein [Myxococcota bacterium]
MNMRRLRMDGRGASLVDCLNDLIEVNLDLICVYHAILGHVPNPLWQDRLAEFRSEHLLHVRDLSQAVRRLYGTPVWPVGKDDDAQLAAPEALDVDPDDVHALLERLSESERAALGAYEQARTVEGVRVHSEIEAIIEYNLEEEAHHRDWLRGVLETL